MIRIIVLRTICRLVQISQANAVESELFETTDTQINAFFDIMWEQDMFEHFISLDHGVRNVGLLCGVEKDFFHDILDANKQLEADHIEAYLAVITSDRALAGIKNIQSTIAITSCYFMETAADVFGEMHKDRKQFDEPFNHKLFDNKTEEVVPAHLLERLCLFAEARQPNWGPNMEQWIDCDKVVAMCNYKEHWGTLLMDFKKQKLVLYDSFQWIFEDHHITNRKDIFLPIARLLPQTLKEIGYFEHHRIKKPILTQWELTLPPKTRGGIPYRTVRFFRYHIPYRKIRYNKIHTETVPKVSVYRKSVYRNFGMVE
ncbi:hypothetical protein OROMI_023499 [Orobanche minor]